MRLTLTGLILLIAAGVTSQAQTVSAGVLGGVPFLDPTNTSSDESPRYQIGPSVELTLPAGFAIEADALYRRIGASGYALPAVYAFVGPANFPAF